MATHEQIAIVLDSARGWTAVPMTTSTGFYDTNHLFYAFHGVYTEFTQECVSKPSGVCIHTWKA